MSELLFALAADALGTALAALALAALRRLAAALTGNAANGLTLA